MTITNLVESIADYFRECMEDAEVDDFKELKDLYGWDSADIKEEIMACLEETYDLVPEGLFESYAGGFDYYDDGSVVVGGQEYSYRQLNALVMKALKGGNRYEN